ncbi:hypothetical protein CC79DRAFT_172613 [Sarocladium strictum]
MEAAGLAFGAVSLSSLLRAGFDIYDQYRTIKDKSDDLADIGSRLELEIQKLRYIQKKCESDILKPDTLELFVLAQQDINIRLARIYSLVLKYVPKSATGNLPAAGTSSAHHSPMMRFEQPVMNFKLTKRKTSLLTWIASDKKNLEEHLLRLQHLTDTVWNIATTEAERVREDYLMRFHTIENQHVSSAIALPVDQYPGIVKAAKVKHLLAQLTREDMMDIEHHFIPLFSLQWHSRSLGEVMSEPWSLGTCERAAGQHSFNQTTTAVLVEWRGAFMKSRTTAPQAAEKRLDTLCQVLGTMHTVDKSTDSSKMDSYTRHADFGLLRCIGWTCSPDKSFERIGLIFQCPPEGGTRRPVSLKAKILEMRAQKRIPPLGDRFDLAFGIANAVANVLSVGWRHRAIRSNTMLAFDHQRRLRNVYLTGFVYARDDADTVWEMSNLPESRTFALYRPPVEEFSSLHGQDSGDNEEDSSNEQGITHGTSAVSAAHDIYGLGIVLLEIGLWDTIDKIKDRKHARLSVHEFQTTRLKEPLEQLSGRCGDIYRGVVERCLDHCGWTTDNLVESLGGMLGSLKQCRA